MLLQSVLRDASIATAYEHRQRKDTKTCVAQAHWLLQERTGSSCNHGISCSNPSAHLTMLSSASTMALCNSTRSRVAAARAEEACWAKSLHAFLAHLAHYINNNITIHYYNQNAGSAFCSSLDILRRQQQGLRSPFNVSDHSACNAHGESACLCKLMSILEITHTISP